MTALITGLALVVLAAVSWLFAVGFLMPAWIPFTIGGSAAAYLFARDGGQWMWLTMLLLWGSAAFCAAHGW